MTNIFAGINVLIRADAAPEIGTGHIMRTHSLAKSLQSAGAHVTYACRNFAGNMIDFLKSENFAVREFAPEQGHRLIQSRTESWLGGKISDDIHHSFNDNYYTLTICDHYGANDEWCRLGQKRTDILMVLDDEAQKTLSCDILLNQNYIPEAHKQYETLLPIDCIRLIGPEFALLRPAFSVSRKKCRTRNALNRILILPGGSDVHDIGKKILDVWNIDIPLTVVTGNASYFYDYKDRAKSAGHTLIQHSEDIDRLMLEADFCIGAGGSTSWERCCLYLPSALFVIAENQHNIVKNLEKAEACINLGSPNTYDFACISEMITSIRNSPTMLKRMSERSGVLCDGKGVLRVMKAIENKLSERKIQA